MSCWFSHNLQPNYSCSTLVFQAREALLYVCTPMTEPAALHYWINLTQLCLFNDVWHLLTTLLLLFYIYGAQHARMTVACNGTVKLYSISWRHMIHMHNGHASFSIRRGEYLRSCCFQWTPCFSGLMWASSFSDFKYSTGRYVTLQRMPLMAWLVDC